MQQSRTRQLLSTRKLSTEMGCVKLVQQCHDATSSHQRSQRLYRLYICKDCELAYMNPSEEDAVEMRWRTCGAVVKELGIEACASCAARVVSSVTALWNAHHLQFWCAPAHACAQRALVSKGCVLYGRAWRTLVH